MNAPATQGLDLITAGPSPLLNTHLVVAYAPKLTMTQTVSKGRAKWGYSHTRIAYRQNQSVADQYLAEFRAAITALPPGRRMALVKAWSDHDLDDDVGRYLQSLNLPVITPNQHLDDGLFYIRHQPNIRSLRQLHQYAQQESVHLLWLASSQQQETLGQILGQGPRPHARPSIRQVAYAIVPPFRVRVGGQRYWEIENKEGAAGRTIT